MAIAADVSVAINGDIRYTGSTANYTVLELLRFLGDLADDAEAAGDDLVDITTSTPADRSTDQIVTLNSPFNIDDTLAEHLYDGSVSQNNGDDLYSGLEVVGTVVAGSEPMVVQDDKVLPAFWGTGINVDAANLIIMRVLVKSRASGADIDTKKIRVLSRELNDQYKEFPVTLGLASSVAAISTATDLNNASTDATIEAWTTIVNTEGFQELDIDGTGAAGQEYYSQWDIGSQTLNDTYERTKWISQRSHIALNGTDTGTNYIIDNATILGQSQSFTSNAQAEKLTEARFRIKTNVGTPTGDLIAEVYATAAGIIPTGAALATSVPVLGTKITATYAEIIFRFNDNFTLALSTQYAVVIRHANGDASNNFHVEGAATGTVAGENKAEDTGSWAAQAAADLWFTLKSSPIIHSIAGEKFRGIDFEIIYDTEAGGPFTEDEVLLWGTDITYDTLAGGPFTEGEYVTIDAAGTAIAGKVLYDNGTVNMIVALEDTSLTILDNDPIVGLSSGATANVNVTILNNAATGGEGILLALDDNGAAGDFYIQLISGGAPVDNLPIRGRTSSATAAVNVTVTSRTISPEFVGQSTGANIIGAYGIGFQPADVGSSDKFTSLDNVLRTPPNNVTFTVTGLVSGEDRVLVGPASGGVLDKAQHVLGTALTSGTETSITVTVTPGSDTPATGTGTDNTRLRVQLDSGIYKRQAYTSIVASVFFIASTDYSTDNASALNDVFIAYIDVLADATTEAYTAVYNVDRNLLVRVRDGGATPIKTFETPATFGSASSSVAAIRTTDA